jgi:hypothetical protein
MKPNITARVQIVVEIDIKLENWNENSSVDQVQREGSERAVARITDLCQRYVRLIGTPKVQAIIADSK